MKNPSRLFTPVTTDRFIVRVLTENDVTGTYLSWFDDEVAVAHIKAASSRQTLDSLRVFVRDKLASPSALLLGVFARDSTSHIGNLKFEPIDISLGTAVVGVLIGDPAWRNRGAFRETFPAAAARICSLLGVHTFWLGVAVNNPAAIQAYRKAGFVERDDPPNRFYPVITPEVIYMAYQVGR